MAMSELLPVGRNGGIAHPSRSGKLHPVAERHGILRATTGQKQE